MPLRMIRNDITKMCVDAIVNPSNSRLIPGGGTDAAIHNAAGPELAKACRAVGHCAPGHAVITDGFALPCRYVIHTVGPRWYDGQHREREILADCYRSCLELANKNGCKTVAFSLIAAGTLAFPKDQALFIAVEELRAWLRFHTDMTVYLVVYDQEAFRISRERYKDVREYIDQNYVNHHYGETRRLRLMPEAADDSYEQPRREGAAFEEILSPAPMYVPERAAAKPMSLAERLKQADVGFSQTLLRWIKVSGMTEAQCYRKARVDRKLFSKIRNDPEYRPSKPTVLSFAVALELDMDRTRELLMKAGYALSNSSKFDIIVEYYIQNGIYDFFQINETLYAFDQSLLGV